MFTSPIPEGAGVPATDIADGACAQILAAIHRAPGRTRNQLARAAGISASTTHKILTRLRDRKLIEPRPSPDRRDLPGRPPYVWHPVPGAPLGCALRRRRPGELATQVLAYLRAHPEACGHTAYRLAQALTIGGLPTSAGAVTGSLDALIRTGRVRRVAGKPIRYRAVDAF